MCVCVGGGCSSVDAAEGSCCSVNVLPMTVLVLPCEAAWTDGQKDLQLRSVHIEFDCFEPKIN